MRIPTASKPALALMAEMTCLFLVEDLQDIPPHVAVDLALLPLGDIPYDIDDAGWLAIEIEDALAVDFDIDHISVRPQPTILDRAMLDPLEHQRSPGSRILSFLWGDEIERRTSHQFLLMFALEHRQGCWRNHLVRLSGEALRMAR
jgi:hypothetical protein